MVAKIKKILSILLVVCFLKSATAALVYANESKKFDKQDKEFKNEGG